MRTLLLGLALGLVAESATGQDRQAARMFTVTPCRFLDTRDSVLLPYERPGPLGDGGWVTSYYHIEEHCGVTHPATAVILNVTVTEATAAGHLSLWTYRGTPGGRPTHSTVNFGVGQTRAAFVVQPLDDVPPGDGLDGVADFMIDAHVPGGTVHVVIDVFGYFANSWPAQGTLSALSSSATSRCFLRTANVGQGTRLMASKRMSRSDSNNSTSHDPFSVISTRSGLAGRSAFGVPMLASLSSASAAMPSRSPAGNPASAS